MNLLFQPSAPGTVGVELEMLLVDASTHDLVDGIQPLIKKFSDITNIKPEFNQNTVEVSTDPCQTLGQLERELRAVVNEVRTACLDLNMTCCGSGLHPFSMRQAMITPSPRYVKMGRNSGYLGRNQMTFATHVHVGMTSAEEMIRLMKELKCYLPMLMVLAANSPFFHGQETGFVCYRQRILAAARSYGIPPGFDGWEQFLRFLQTAMHANIFDSIHDIHWDIRPRPHLGTLEIRVMDAQASVIQVVRRAALIRTLLSYLRQTTQSERDHRLPRSLPWFIEKDNYYQAGHLGLQAKCVVDEKGTVRPLGQMVADMLVILKDHAQEQGADEYLEGLSEEVEQGLGYSWQRKIYQENGNIKNVVTALIKKMGEA